MSMSESTWFVPYRTRGDPVSETAVYIDGVVIKNQQRKRTLTLRIPSIPLPTFYFYVVGFDSMPPAPFIPDTHGVLPGLVQFVRDDNAEQRYLGGLLPNDELDNPARRIWFRVEIERVPSPITKAGETGEQSAHQRIRNYFLTHHTRVGRSRNPKHIAIECVSVPDVKFSDLCYVERTPIQFCNTAGISTTERILRKLPNFNYMQRFRCPSKIVHATEGASQSLQLSMEQAQQLFDERGRDLDIPLSALLSVACVDISDWTNEGILASPANSRVLWHNALGTSGVREMPATATAAASNRGALINAAMKQLQVKATVPNVLCVVFPANYRLDDFDEKTAAEIYWNVDDDNSASGCIKYLSNCQAVLPCTLVIPLVHGIPNHVPFMPWFSADKINPTIMETLKQSIALSALINASFATCFFTSMNRPRGKTNQTVFSRAKTLAEQFVATTYLRVAQDRILPNPHYNVVRERERELAGLPKKSFRGGDTLTATQTGVIFGDDTDGQTMVIGEADFQNCHPSVLVEHQLCISDTNRYNDPADEAASPTAAMLDFALRTEIKSADLFPALSAMARWEMKMTPLPRAVWRILSIRRNPNAPIEVVRAAKYALVTLYGALATPTMRFYLLGLSRAIAFWSRTYVAQLRALILKIEAEYGNILLSITDNVVFSLGTTREYAEERLRFHIQACGWKVMKIPKIKWFDAIYIIHTNEYVVLPRGHRWPDPLPLEYVKGTLSQSKDCTPQQSEVECEFFMRLLAREFANPLDFVALLEKRLQELFQSTDPAVIQSARNIREAFCVQHVSAKLYHGVFGAPAVLESRLPHALMDLRKRFTQETENVFTAAPENSTSKKRKRPRSDSTPAKRHALDVINTRDTEWDERQLDSILGGDFELLESDNDDAMQI